MRRHLEPFHKHLMFGFNRWKQKPLRVVCPGGTIFLERERGGTVAVTLVPNAGPGGATVRLLHEEEPGA